MIFEDDLIEENEGEELKSSVRVKSKKNLLIEGQLLTQIMEHKERKRFTKYIMQYDCVVFSRTSPKQKVNVVRLLKEMNIQTLAIGDGANDVNMIQEASVGIGLEGEEGD